MLKTLGTHNYYIYILTNISKTVLYTGVTNNLVDRIRFHKENTNINKKALRQSINVFI